MRLNRSLIALLSASILMGLVAPSSFAAYQSGSYNVGSIKVTTHNSVVTTPESFGANGQDSKLDTLALQQAIHKGDKVVLKGGATYYIDQPLVANKNLIITTTDGKKATIVQKSAQSAFIFDNKPKATTTVTKTVRVNQNYITVKDASKIKIGDLLHIKSSKLWYWDNRGYLTKGELSKVTKVEGNNVYLDLSARESYYISGETLTVNAYTPKNLKIEHIEFKHPQPMSTVMVKVGFTENALFQDIIIRNSKKIGLMLDKTLHSHVTKSFFSLGTTPDISSGYGVQDYGGRHNTISYSTFASVRRGVDFSGDTPSRFGVVKYSKAYGPPKHTLAVGNSGFGTHSTAEDITFHNNTIIGFNYGFNSRGNRITIKDNTMTGNSVTFAAISYGNNVTLLRNHFQRSSLEGNSLEHFALIFASYKGKVTAEQNKVEYLTKDFVRVAGTDLQTLRLVDNRANVYTDLNPMYVIRSGSNIKLQNTTLLRNYMWMKTGTKKYVSKTVDLSDKSNQIDYIH